VAAEEGSSDVPPVRLEPTHDKEHEEDDQDDADDTDAAVTVAVTVAAEPAAEAAEQEVMRMMTRMSPSDIELSPIVSCDRFSGRSTRRVPQS
jgi:hypothetical protein